MELVKTFAKGLPVTLGVVAIGALMTWDLVIGAWLVGALFFLFVTFALGAIFELEREAADRRQKFMEHMFNHGKPRE